MHQGKNCRLETNVVVSVCTVTDWSIIKVHVIIVTLYFEGCYTTRHTAASDCVRQLSMHGSFVMARWYIARDAATVR